jgi:hypothetical protein
MDGPVPAFQGLSQALCKTAPDLLSYAEQSLPGGQNRRLKDCLDSGSGFDAAKPPDDARLGAHGASAILISKFKPFKTPSGFPVGSLLC